MGKRQKLYVVLMLLGGVALIVDRTLLAPVEEEPPVELVGKSGASPGRSPTARTVSAGATTPAEAPPIPELPFPREIPPAVMGGTTRDVFEPVLAHTEAARQADNSGLPTSELTSAMFVTRHRLDGVILGEGLKIAVVNGQWIRVGQTLEGCKLVALEGSKAHFGCADGPATLTVTVTSGRRGR